ncbi:hypothetical protein Trydic_g4534, partial [Trypoxylus dichotomus]
MYFNELTTPIKYSDHYFSGLMLLATFLLVVTFVGATTSDDISLVNGCQNAKCPYDISPPANVTFFPHDSDCSRYCMCDWYSTAHVMDCPDGLYWNTDFDTCDWPHNVPRCSDAS